MNDPSLTPQGRGTAVRWTLTWLALTAGGAALVWGLRLVGGDHDTPQVYAQDHHPTAIAFGAASIAGAVVFFLFHRRWYSSFTDDLAAFTARVDALSDSVRRFDLLLASVLGLFLEVALIRWHGTEFRACAYFKSLTLLACFLGLGLGFARARRPVLSFPIALLILSVQVLVMDVLSLAEADRAVRNPLDGEILWGLGTMTNVLHHVVFYGFFAALYVATILVFIPIGQLTGRLMDPQRPIASYTINILGSLLGVALFAGASFLWLPPVLWFGLAAVIAVWLSRHSRTVLAASAGATVLMLAWLGYEPRRDVQNVYSPYQRLEISPSTVTFHDGTHVQTGVRVAANKTYYLHALNLSDEFVSRFVPRGVVELRDKAAAYNLPYRLGPAPADVLIVGAGAGNDAAAAVRNGAERIDAVEIDPAILWAGRMHHPESPYGRGEVHAVVADARAYMKRSPPARYDMVVFGLLDSHTLLSGMAAIRLDNFVYTVESLREARRLLRPGGRLCLSFAAGTDSVFTVRMFRMLESTFGHAPRTFRLQETDTMFVVGLTPDDVVVPSDLSNTPETTGELSARDASKEVPFAEDDWPFPFLTGRQWKDFPRAYLHLIALLALISTVWVLASREHGVGGTKDTVTRAARRRDAGHFFFLGAAFLLIETKGITELALVFGTTWIVSSVVIAAILVLILLANWFVALARPHGVTAAYLGLFVALAASYFISPQALMDHGSSLAAWAAPALVCLPLLFAGVIFATSLKRCANLPAAFSSNLLGAMLGGFCEYAGMVYGFRGLTLIGAGLYLLSWWMVAGNHTAARN
jgi:spermidine synthase